LELIAKPRLELCDTSLRPDLATLGLMLSPADTGMYNYARRLLLGLLTQTSPVVDAVVDAGALCSNFFTSTAIGDVTKWRLLSLVVFQEWRTTATEWKDLIAAEVLKVDWVNNQRVDWMARVTPTLAGTFNLSEFMVDSGLNSDSDFDPTFGRLTSLHFRMVGIILDHFGPEGLTAQAADELEEFLEDHSRNLDDLEPLDRIRAVIVQAKARNSQG
jgi:hypothetical protein